MKKYILTLCGLVALSFSCQTKKESKNEIPSNENLAKEKQLTKADSIIDGAIAAHGGKRYDKADYSFDFRDKKFRFKTDGGNFEYSSEIQKKDSLIKDEFNNTGFKRYINNSLQKLDKETSDKYAESLNSVIYFATLPYKLQDASVHKKFVEETDIKGKRYEAVLVTFGQEGGGKDFDDQYMYWINKETHKMDYFAYNYQVNNGGVRFRAAFNPRVVEGITFQDYINYEAPLKTELKDLPKLYEANKLKVASEVITANVVHHSKE